MPSAQRVCVDFVLGAGECARLTWLLQALAHTSYRPHVVSVTAWEVARCDPRLLVPLVRRARCALVWLPPSCLALQRRTPQIPLPLLRHSGVPGVGELGAAAQHDWGKQAVLF